MTADENERPKLKLPLDTWPIILFGTVLSAFFFLLGVNQLIASYETNDPYLFLMLFFSSSMIILVNGTIFFVLGMMALRKLRHPKQPDNHTDPPKHNVHDTEPL